MAACFIASMYGKYVNMKYTQSYVEGWSGGKNHVASKLLRLLPRVEAIYNFIETRAMPLTKVA